MQSLICPFPQLLLPFLGCFNPQVVQVLPLGFVCCLHHTASLGEFYACVGGGRGGGCGGGGSVHSLTPSMVSKQQLRVAWSASCVPAMYDPCMRSLHVLLAETAALVRLCVFGA